MIKADELLLELSLTAGELSDVILPCKTAIIWYLEIV